MAFQAQSMEMIATYSLKRSAQKEEPSLSAGIRCSCELSFGRNRMKIVRPRPGTLKITKSRIRAASQLVFTVLFISAWYSFLFALNSSPDDAPALFKLLFWLAPLFSVPEMVRQTQVLTSGETFVLTRDTGTIERNGMCMALFSDVARIQIRTFRDPEGGSDYRLSIVLKNDEKLRIHQSSDANEVSDLAEDLADLLTVEITRKG
jgi:hypothetical protein